MIGSSPHTRGALGFGRVRRRRQRIIPAYAGSTSGVYAQHSSAEDHPRIRGEHGLHQERPRGPGLDHPRIRGEHSGNDVRELEPRGSSPHTRGAPIAGRSFGNASGIIPAYAGSTSCGLSHSPREWDHPRIRGEHPRHTLRSLRGAGSSPHTRGAHHELAERVHKFRIIPAYAGSTGSIRWLLLRCWDHPRIRGEHVPGH